MVIITKIVKCVTYVRWRLMKESPASEFEVHYEAVEVASIVGRIPVISIQRKVSVGRVGPGFCSMSMQTAISFENGRWIHKSRPNQSNGVN